MVGAEGLRFMAVHFLSCGISVWQLFTAARFSETCLLGHVEGC
jgi:hypothetical protein